MAIDVTPESATVCLIVASLLAYGLIMAFARAHDRGYDEALGMNESYHKMVLGLLRIRIEAREHALAMYRDISTTLCDNTSDCMYCPYERDKNDRKCVLWELNEVVERMDIDEVHVNTKHDRGDCD